ncbi:hypothetical protein BH10PSE17_BH10PSE17_09040 [soil metagenome]
MNLFEPAAPSVIVPEVPRRVERLFAWHVVVKEQAGVRTLRIEGSATARGSRLKLSGPLTSFEVSTLRAVDSDGWRYRLVSAESADAVVALQESLRAFKVPVTWNGWPYEWVGPALTGTIPVEPDAEIVG